MRCPQCGTLSKPGAAICAKCDFVLDPAAFGAEPSDDTQPAEGEAEAEADVTREVVIPAAATRSAAARAPAVGDVGPALASTPETPEEWLAELRSAFLERRPTDRGLIAALLACLISALFPWKETASDGDALGITSAGFLYAAMAGGALWAAIARGQKRKPMKEPLGWLVQTGLVAGMFVFALVFTAMVWDSKLVRSPIGNIEIWTSKPKVGVFLAVVFSAVAGAVSVLQLKERPR